jgi:hypothetical protein
MLAGAGACSSDGGSDDGDAAKRASVGSPAATGTGGSGGSASVAKGTGGAPNTGGKAGGSPSIGGASGMGGAGTAGMMGTGGAPAMTAGTGGSTPPTKGPPVGTGSTCLQPGDGSYLGPGPYKTATKEVDLGMIEPTQHTGKFTIYYPDPLEADCKHPIVAWGNGTTVMGSGTYTFLTGNAAAWGMVVAESQEDNTGSGNFHKAGIDYLLKENADPNSIFYQKLDTRAATSGHSQGGIGANAGATHPNVVTEVIEGMTGVASDKVSLLILTGTEDIVMGAEDLVTMAKGPMFVANWEGGDHFTTETVAGVFSGDKGTVQFQRLYTAWLRCMLADDAVACALFTGGTPDNCGICKDSGWHALASSNL